MMKRIKIIVYLCVFFPLVIMTSCQKVSQQDTAVLSEPTCAIIDYFLDENKEWLSDSKQLVIDGYTEENRSSFYLNIYNNDTSVYKPYGKYNGMVRYKGYKVLLFGDSWDEFFWTCDTIYNIPDMNDWWVGECCYDPAEWNIYICCKDTTINRSESRLFLPYGEHHNMLCDSLQKIIKNSLVLK